MNEPISDIDLNAYVDGELDAQRRIEVEAYLEANPEEAARVMHDMRVRDEIGLFMAGPAVEKAAAEMVTPQPAAEPAPPRPSRRSAPARRCRAASSGAPCGAARRRS
ncbi:hypothetical protein [Azospirillum formosense]|uniref:anti-sigma factor family protein n=1 Tax=Azospirillum formosense TaxID=861533 RepID=UPI00338DA6F4